MPKSSNPLIIERPDLQSKRQRAVFGVLTAFFWLLWMVLWMPLITIFGWAFFGYHFHVQMVEQEGYTAFLDVLRAYAGVTVLMVGSLLIWAKYNDLRFRGMDRRKAFPAPSIEAIAAVHGRQSDDIAQWQQMNIVTVHHDPKGRIERVDAGQSTKHGKSTTVHPKTTVPSSF